MHTRHLSPTSSGVLEKEHNSFYDRAPIGMIQVPGRPGDCDPGFEARIMQRSKLRWALALIVAQNDGRVRTTRENR